MFYDTGLLKSDLLDFAIVWAMNYYFEKNYPPNVLLIHFYEKLGEWIDCFSGCLIVIELSVLP